MRRNHRNPCPKKKKVINVSLFAGHPFLEEHQKNVLVERMLEKRTLQGKPCVGYKFRLDLGEGAFASGMAWLEDPTGAPLEVRFTQRPLPPHTKDIITTLRFEHTPEGVWREIESITESKVGFLFMTKYIVLTEKRSDFWEKKEKPPPPEK